MQRAKRREHQRQADHQRHQPGGHAQLDDQHPVRACRSAAPSPCPPTPGTATGAAAGPAAVPRVAASANGRNSVPMRIHRFDEFLADARSCSDELQGLGGVEAARDALRAADAPTPRAPALRQALRRSAASDNGSIAGARSRRGNSRPTAPHERQAPASCGANVKTIERSVRAAKPASTRTTSRARVVDQRVHRDHMIEAAERRVEHVADAKIDAAAPRASAAAARARAAPASATDRRRPPAAPRCAASTLSAPVPQPASSSRAPRRSAGSQPSSVARIASRPARTVARMRLDRAPSR